MTAIQFIDVDMNQKNIGILGCGWLGKALAKSLIYEGHQVKGSTTSQEKLSLLLNDGIEAHLIQLPEIDNEQSFWNIDILVIAFPPGLRKGNPVDYISKVDSILNQIRKHNYAKVIFISSTSIYTSDGSIKKEDEADQSHTLFETELKLEEACRDVGTTFISARCGGLMGYDRFPCKYFNPDKPISGALSKVNYIHRDDVVTILSLLIQNNNITGTFNLVSDDHPTRKEVLKDCFNEQRGIIPDFSNDSKPYKIVDNSKIKKVLNFTFKYSNPLSFHYEF